MIKPFGGNIWMPKMHQKPFKNISNLDGCPYRFAGIIVLPWREANFCGTEARQLWKVPSVSGN